MIAIGNALGYGQSVTAGIASALNTTIEGYEGKLIQAGLKSKQGTAMESNEFKFSVTDSVVANKLMRSGGRVLELHYKEYKSPLPWRGVSEFIVDEILE